MIGNTFGYDHPLATKPNILPQLIQDDIQQVWDTGQVGVYENKKTCSVLDTHVATGLGARQAVMGPWERGC